MIKKFDFKSQLLHTLSFLDPGNTQGIKQQHTFDQLGNILPVTFDRAALKIEHREFVVDSDLDCTESDATNVWLNIYNNYEVTHGCIQVQESCCHCP